MKTVRFAQVLEASGKPVNHLVLTSPSKDRSLQSAVKEKRVMTLFQPDAGHKADHGEIGFRPGKSRQFLVFPKSLGAFTRRKVIGIDYGSIRHA